MSSSFEKSDRRRKLISFAAFICFTLALILLILLRLFQMESVMRWYDKYTDTLASYEAWIQQNGATFFSVAIILANFVIKAVLPWFPISCIMVAAGVLFKWYYAILINIAGLTLLFTIKYYWGKKFGGGNAEKILAKYDKAHTFIDKGKLGSTLVLFTVRLIPCMPINAVSQLYGTTGIEYYKYLLISLAGFSYKLFSYTIIGRNVYNPFSAQFIIPFVLLFIFSGIVLLGLSGAISFKSFRTTRKK
ncbi:MAG: TVP38/TMEM64 family protein [Acutalibacteraceae bacterium]